MKPKVLFLNDRENAIWTNAFEWHSRHGKDDNAADELAWKEVKAKSPRLRKWNGKIA